LEILRSSIKVDDYVTFPFVVADEIFSNDELEKIIQYCDSKNIGKAVIGGLNELDESIRNAKTGFHRLEEDNEWLFDMLLHAATSVNDHFYNFDLWGFESFQYTVYDEPGSHYDYHPDMIFGEYRLPEDLKMPRKLSFSLILSDPSEYSGGQFEFMYQNPNKTSIVDQPKGRIIAFPSYILHRVKPIVSGVRKSIVFWVTGPKFK
jgi:PKHD-type hydroxylase